MRVLLLSCFLGLGLAAPQGYFYQTLLDGGIGGVGAEGHSQISLEQYQIQQQQEQNQLEQQKLQALQQQQFELQHKLQQQVQEQQQQQVQEQLLLQQQVQEQQQIQEQLLLQQQVQEQQQQLQQQQLQQQQLQQLQQQQLQQHQIQQQQLQQQQLQQQQLQQQQLQQQLQQPQLQQQQFQQQLLLQQKALPEQQLQQSFVVIGNHTDLGQLVQVVQHPPLQQQLDFQQQAAVETVATRSAFETAAPAAQPQQQVFEAPTATAAEDASLQQPAASEASEASATARPQVAPLQSSASAANLSSYQPAQTMQFHKEFYFLAAPQEDPSELEQSVQKQLGQMRKNLRVVFIKAPEHNGLTEAALQVAQQSLDTQTAIYVLTKQHDVADLAAKLQRLRDSSGSSRPEVTFVKYRTPQEAEQAQRTIQAQFAALNGPNSFNYEGVANFVGSADLRSTSASATVPAVVSGTSAGSGASATTESTAAAGADEAKSPGGHYLPAAVTAKH